MKFDKQSILILVCGAFFLIGWYTLMHHLGWIPQRVPAPEKENGPVPPSSQEQGEVVEPPVQVPSREPAAEQEPPPEEQPLTTPADLADTAAGPPAATTQLTSEQGKASFDIDSHMGGIVGTSLHAYEPYGRKGSGDSVRLGTWHFPFCSLRLPGIDDLDAGEVAVGEEAVSVSRTAQGGLRIKETWRFLPDQPYRFSYLVELVNDGDQPVSVTPLLGLGGLTTERGAAGPKMARVGTLDLGVDVAIDLKGRPQSLTAKKIGKRTPEGQPAVNTGSPAAWVAVHNKYFTYFLRPTIPEEGGGTPIRNVVVGTRDLEAEPVEEPEAAVEWVHATGQLPELTLEPGAGPTVLTFEAYAGPKKLKLLEQLAPNADSIMRLDFFMFFRAAWMELIAKTILRSLIALNGVFGGEWGYGFAIVVVTVVIKTLFWPLTHHQTVSMRRMAALQPKIKEIRDKYKDESQLIQRKTMELYRENKVNPAGGCLPMLLQIPVFFALFNTLRGAVELRHAAFLYIPDLSMPDTLTPFGDGLPIRPLAIIMGGTMLLQQSLTPTSGDPSQKRMMTFMTLFFMFIFYSMPSGLTLYWTTNQILTIGQNLVTRRIEHRATAAAAKTEAS